MLSFPKAVVLSALAFGAMAAHAQSSFSVTFNESQPLPSALELGFGNDYGLLETNLYFNGDVDSGRTYFNTSFKGYYDLSFVAEVSFQLQGGLFFMGLGQADAYGGEYGEIGLEDGLGPVVGVRLHPSGVADGLLGTIDHTGGQEPAFDEFGHADLNASLNLVRFTWDGASHSGFFEIDAGSATYTSSLLFGGDNGFSAESTFLYFGSSGGGYVQSVDVTLTASAIPEPSTYAAFAGVLAGFVALYARRRQRLGAA